MDWKSAAVVNIQNRFPEPFRPDVVRGDTTLLVNAAINDGANVPANAPWLVDLMLPRSDDSRV